MAIPDEKYQQFLNRDYYDVMKYREGWISREEVVFHYVCYFLAL